jgi:hypothetical protein
MEAAMNAIEMMATVNEDHQLQLDAPLPFTGPQRVRVIVLYSSENDDVRDEMEWLKAAASNPAFADLADPGEDIYTEIDGKPFHDEA